MQMCPKIVETWHKLIILKHNLDIKRSQHFDEVIVYIVHKPIHMRISFYSFELELPNLN
jgi:hypothetical protein